MKTVKLQNTILFTVMKKRGDEKKKIHHLLFSLYFLFTAPLFIIARVSLREMRGAAPAADATCFEGAGVGAAASVYRPTTVFPLSIEASPPLPPPPPPSQLAPFAARTFTVSVRPLSEAYCSAERFHYHCPLHSRQLQSL